MQKAHMGRRVSRLLVCGVASAILMGCGGGGGGGSSSGTMQPPQAPAPPPPQEMPLPPLDPSGQNLGALFAVTNSNRFVSFNPGASALSTNVAITGLSGLQVAGLDVRTADGMVVVVTSRGDVFALDPRSGIASSLGGFGLGSDTALAGVEFLGSPEEVRIVSEAGRNVSFGDFAQLDFDLRPRRSVTELPPVISGIAEIAATQAALPCGGTSVLYYLDTARDRLLVERRDGGSLVLDAVGPLGVDADAAAGFEIFQRPDGADVALATLRVNGVLSLYGIDLATGRASVQSPIPPGLRSTETLVGLASPPLAAPPRLGTMVALTQSGKLMSFDERAPLAVCTPARAVTGLQRGEQILDLDVRAADGQLYALTSAGRVYTLSTALDSFGAATFKSTLQPRPGDAFRGLTAPAASIDFDAGRDLLSVLDGNLQLQVDVDLGLVTTPFQFSTLSGGGPFLNAITGSFAPSPDPGRRRVEFLQNELDLGPDPITGFDVRGLDALRFVARRVGRLSGSVLESGLDSVVTPQFRALIGGGEAITSLAYLPVARATVFALTTDDKMLTLKSSTPSELDATVAITGLQPDEELLAIEVRVVDDLLYGLSDRGRIYTINAASGAASLRSTLTGTDAPTFPNQEVDIAFSPVSGLLRISAAGGRNFRVNVDTGAVQMDATYTRARSELPPQFTGVAYIPDAPVGATGRFLLIDAANRQLAAVIESGEAAGAVRSLGRLSAPMVSLQGFDITPSLEGLVVASTAEEPATLFNGNLQSGGISEVGVIRLPSAGDRVTGLAADPSGQPGRLERSILLCSIAAL